MNNDDARYDLTVIGEAAVDNLMDFTPPIRRPGGAFYSAIAAKAVGLDVAVGGIGGETGNNEFIPIIENLGINDRGILPNSQSCIEYRIYNSNEIVPQVISSRSPDASVQIGFPDDLTSTKAILLYPTKNSALLIGFVEKAKKTGCLICLDLQHDIELSSLNQLIELADVIFASRNELLTFTGTKTDKEAINYIWNISAKMVVVKYGMGGSTIYRCDEPSIQIPAFQANFKCTIGAGDTYNAIFISGLLKNKELETIGVEAALAASVFSENLEFEKIFEVLKNVDFDREKSRRFQVLAHPEQLSSLKIYLAGSFLSIPMRNWVDLVTVTFESRGFSVFSPYRDVGLLSLSSQEGVKTKYFELDVINLANSNFVVALLDNIYRGGVSWELGYAYSKNIPIFGLLTDDQASISNMISQSCRTINSNLPSLLNDIFQYIMEKHLL